ncbi:MAG: TetR/AcrR family transcriptional regulator [Syntrophorhabdales bacterium]|jgi:AcrR family transcriptional regulator
MLKKRPTINRELRRDQIVGAALGIIARKGMGGLTTAAIAAEANMSEANLYRHYANKEEILLEVIKKIGDGLKGNIDKSLQGVRSPVERLRSVFQLHLHYLATNEGIPRLVFSEEIHHHNPALRGKLLEVIGLYSGRLTGIMKEGQEARVIAPDMDPEALASIFIGMVQVVVLKWVLSGFSFSIEEEGLKLWDNFEKLLSGER